MERARASIPSQVIIYDATRNGNERELGLTIRNVLARGDILHAGDTLLLLGVLHTVPNPSAIEEEVPKKVDAYVTMLLKSAERCEDAGISVQVKVTAGTPTKKVILQEVLSCKANCVILDRHLGRDSKYYEKHMYCKVALIQDSLSVQMLKAQPTNVSTADQSEHSLFYYLAKSVQPNVNIQEPVNNEPSVISIGSSYAYMSSLDSSDAS